MNAYISDNFLNHSALRVQWVRQTAIWSVVLTLLMPQFVMGKVPKPRPRPKILAAESPMITCPPDIVASTDAGQCSKSNVTFTATTTNNATVVCTPPSGSTFAAGTNTVTCTATDGANMDDCSFSVIVDSTTDLSVVMTTSLNPVAVGSNLTYTITVSNGSPCTATGVTLSNSLSAGQVLFAVTDTVNGSAVGCPNPGPVAWWRAEGDATDAVGGNNGTLQNGAAFAPGQVGQGFAFDGINGHVTVPDSPALRPANLTIEGWFRFSDTTGGRVMVQKEAGDQSASYQVVLADGRLFAFVGDAGSIGNPLAYDLFPMLGQWYHIAYTFEDATKAQALYVNGMLVTSGNSGRSPVYDSHAVRIGAGSLFDIPTAFLAGGIDEVAIYNRALSAAEIQGIYNTGSFGKCVTPHLVSLGTLASGATATVTVGVVPTTSNSTVSNVVSVSANEMDSNLANNSATGIVTVGNTPPPGITCPSDIVASTDNEQCSKSNVTFTATTTNNAPVVCTPPSGSTFPVGTNAVSCAATDSSGNTNTCAFTVTVRDAQAPGVMVLGANPLTNECQAAFSDPGATAEDSCDASPTLTTNSTVDPNVPGSYTITYVATDSSGNSATNTRTVVVVDTVAPVVALLGANPLNLVLHSSFIDPGATATDTCAGSLSVTTNGTVDVNVVGTYEVRYSASDPSGNSNGIVRIVQVTDATAAEPSITQGPTNQTVECGSDALLVVTATGTEPLYYQWYFFQTNTLAEGTNATLVLSNVTAAAAGDYTVVVTNASGSVTSSVATLTVVDTAVPVVTLLGANPQTNECHAAFSDPGATAEDSCDPSPALTTNSTVNPNVPGSYTITYVATDSSGNSATNTRTVVVVDALAPVVTVLGANPLTNECHAAFSDPGATAEDSCDASPTLTTNSTVDPNVPGSYTITYVATDSSGNSATNMRTVVVVDTVAPVVTVLGDNPLILVLHSAFIDPGATATDNCAGSLSVTTNGTVDVNVVGTYEVRYSANDPSGNSNGIVRIVHVTDATAAEPSITQGPTNQTVECGSDALLVVTATGTEPLYYQWYFFQTNALPEGTNATLILSNVTLSSAGDYTVVVTNASGSVTSSVATLTVVDTAVPVVTLLGANPLTSECHAAFSDPGATAEDSCDGSPTLTTNSTVNPNVPGSYTITYVATDSSGNSATDTRTVIVVDTMPPVLTLLGTNPLTNECQAAFSDPGATAEDSCDASPTLTTNSTVNPNVPGSYTVTYVATDSSGNSATNTRTVVVRETAAPALICPADVSTNTCGPSVAVSYAAPSVSGGTLTDCTPASGSTFNVGTTPVTCTATNACATSTCAFTVTVRDTEPPGIVCPADILTMALPGENFALVNFVVTAVDTCDANSLMACTPPSGSAFPAGTHPVRCTATDASGNTNTCAFVVTVVLPGPLELICPTDLVVNAAVVQCSTSVGYTVSFVSTNTDLVIVCTPPSGATFRVGTNTVTCRGRDSSGHTATCTFTVTVRDVAAPFLSCPTNLIVTAALGSDSAVVHYPVTVIDNCDKDARAVCTPPSDSTFPLGTSQVICVATDSERNTNTCAFSVTVAPPPTALIGLPFSESGGTNTLNLGLLNDVFGLTTPFPQRSTNVPGPFGAPGAIDLGVNAGDFAVDSPQPLAGLGGLSQFTITGWLNNRSTEQESGGNRIVSWLQSSNGTDGVELVYRNDGSLHLGVNEGTDTSPARSSARIPTDVTAPNYNWRFFAVTYDAVTGQARFYIGSRAVDAFRDVVRSYPGRGVVGPNVGRFTVGNVDPALRAQKLFGNFRGLIDEVQVFGVALSQAEIVAVQRHVIVASPRPAPPLAPAQATGPTVTGPGPRLLSIKHDAGGAIRLGVSGVAGHAYRLEAANRLGDWSIIATNLAGPEGTLEFIDSDTAGRATRFYRVLAP